MRAVVFLCLCAGVAANAVGDEQLVAVQSGGTQWWDCGDNFTTPMDLHWTDVQSTPAVVHKGDQQKVMKTGYATAAHSNITIEYQQFWRIAGKWLKFLDMKVDGCSEHAEDHFCPTAPGKNFTLHSIHPKLNKMTPFGMYRSRQHYFGADGVTVIGCVDMLVPYEK